MRIPSRLLAALAVCVTLTATATACGSDSDDSGGTPLESALSGVPSSLSKEVVTYQNVSVTRGLVAHDDKKHPFYSAVGTFGLVELTSFTTPPLKSGWGVSEKDFKTSVLVGDEPVGRQTGTFDLDAVTKAMKKQGYKVKEDDGVSHFTKKGQETVDISGTVRSTWSPKAHYRLSVDEPDKSLADDKDYQAVMDCMGDPYYATVYAKHMGKNHNVTLLGIGARLDKEKGSSEKLCAMTVSKGAAEATAKTLRDNARGPYEGAKVDEGSGKTPIVTMTWKNTEKVPPGAYNQNFQLPDAVLKLI